MEALAQSYGECDLRVPNLMVTSQEMLDTLKQLEEVRPGSQLYLLSRPAHS